MHVLTFKTEKDAKNNNLTLTFITACAVLGYSLYIVVYQNLEPLQAGVWAACHITLTA